MPDFTRRTTGRSVPGLLADFGHVLPPAPEAPPPAKEPRLFHNAALRGHRSRDAGWSPAKAPVSQWRMTSEQAPALWPFIAAPGLPPTGDRPALRRRVLLRPARVGPR